MLVYSVLCGANKHLYESTRDYSAVGFQQCSLKLKTP